MGGELMLVVWDLRQQGAGRSVRREFARRVAANARSMDVVGWLDGARIGALLPAADREGARSFARRVSEGVREGGEPLAFDTLRYPGGRDQEAVELDPVPAWKRAMDIAGSSVLLLVGLPLLAVIALYITCMSPGKVLFRQERVGRGGRPFRIMKFRTMHMDSADAAHQAYLASLIHGRAAMTKLDDGRDPRIFRGGGFLRATSLDELPQLVNVLKGEMSLVGPRPCLPYEARQLLPWHTARFDVLPGMTGLWQVSGKNRLTFEEMMRMDAAYAKNLCFRRDASILLRTIPTVVGLSVDALRERAGRRRSYEKGSLGHV